MLLRCFLPIKSCATSFLCFYSINRHKNPMIGSRAREAGGARGRCHGFLDFTEKTEGARTCLRTQNHRKWQGWNSYQQLCDHTVPAPHHFYHGFPPN